jgi:hypothetical protein
MYRQIATVHAYLSPIPRALLRGTRYGGGDRVSARAVTHGSALTNDAGHRYVGVAVVDYG